MKKISPILLILVGVLLVLAACQTATTPAAPAATNAPVATDVPATAPAAPVEPTKSEAAASPIVLTVTDKDGQTTRTFTLDDLKKLPVTTGQAGIKSSTGKITPPSEFTGIQLMDIVKEIGGADSSMSIQLEAEDGYAMTFSYDQVNTSDYIVYDPATGDEIKKEGDLKTILAYEMDGKPLDQQKDGNLRLVVVSDKPYQVVDGHWSVKFISKMSLKPLAEEWSLSLEGAIDDSIDRGSFESCSTGKCHGNTWQDNKAQTWTGTPLYLLVGRVDDETKHSEGAFNTKLADQGYTVEVVAKDGYSVTLDSARIKGNKDIILAYQVNNNPLTEKDFPLKLVGVGLSGKESVGAVDKIILHLGQSAATAAPTETPKATETAAPVATQPAGENTSNAALSLTGLVKTPQNWNLDDLKKQEVVKLTVEHPKKGKQDVEGVRLNALLDLAGVNADAKKLVISSIDGFTVEVDLKAVRDCKDCLIAFNQSGGLKAVMPGMESGFWAKDVIKLEVK